ncbi:MAG: type II CRISPR-associated endonuclease Cas1 [Mollicutes bacterium]|nr:type II CRISPR-associated endonuclease Cas1 [Mollicutes bacterium]
MSYRTVVIQSKCKLKYHNNYLVVRGEKLNRIHIDEIGLLLIDSTQVVITTMLINELIKKKVKIVFCNEKRNPAGELIPLYGGYNNTKKINIQINWLEDTKETLWQLIVQRKILMQAKLLEKMGCSEYTVLLEYAKDVKKGDVSNREGHAAKVYFNSLFPENFKRFNNDNINAALNYGYSILASYINREIISFGYLTQLGIKHRNEFNNFNLTYDLIEPLRTIVDEYVIKNIDRDLTSDYKMELVNLLNKKVKIKNQEHYLTNAITIYLTSVFDYLENNGKTKIIFIDLNE